MTKKDLTMLERDSARLLEPLETSQLAKAIGERDQLAGLLKECLEMADNWPGIAYSYDLVIRAECALANLK